MQSADVIVAEEELAAAFFSEPLAERHSTNLAFDLDFSVINRAFLDGLTETGELSQLGGGRLLLPPNYVWSGKNGKTRAPMALCEFVAYKAALAYEEEKDIKANVGNVQHFGFFDTSKDGLSDTQGFAFMYDGVAFVIMRGTEKRSDWKINLQDQLTDQLQAPKKWKLVRRLKKRHGDKVVSLLDGLAAKPGRHLGFAIGWAAVHDKVSAHLKTHCPPGVPVVLGGHSLGGALALVGAMELKREGHDIAAVVTFGAPQAGNDAFSREYAAEGLRERTVLFEAQGDSVPRIMRRWYYRLHRSLRERVDGFAASNATAVPRSQFAVAGNPWTFNAQPPLSATEAAGAIRAIIDARNRKAKEEEERKAKEVTPPAATPEPGAGIASTTTPAPVRAPASAQETGSTNGKVAWLIVGGVLGLFLLLFLWLFVRSKLSAHAVIDRYALFLSTLSYQRIRSLRALEPGTAADKLNIANAELSRYMRFIRADIGSGSYIGKAKATDLPVRLKADLDLKTFLSDPKNII